MVSGGKTGPNQRQMKTLSQFLAFRGAYPKLIFFLTPISSRGERLSKLEQYFFVFFCCHVQVDRIISPQKHSVSLFCLNKSVPYVSQQFLNYIQLFHPVLDMSESIGG